MMTVSLGEVAEMIMGQAPPGRECNKDGRGTIFVKAGEFNGRHPVVREWTTRPLKIAKSSDVLVCVVGATAGKVSASIDCAIGRSVAAVRPRADKVCTDYLYHYLTTQTDALRAQSQGLAQGVITREMLRDVLLPMPPLDEQKRIAAILDQADDLRRKRREVMGRLEKFYFAAFVEMFGEPVANPKGWPTSVHLGDVAETSGITKGRKLNGAATRLVPYLAVVNVQDRKLNLETVKTIEATESEISRYKLLKNDLVLTEGGDPDKLGRGALWQNEIPECIHQNHIFRVRLQSEIADPTFMNWLVGGPRGKAYFLRSAKQTTGIASINMTQLRGFPLILPPIDLQRAFAARVAEIDKLKAHHQGHLAKLDALFASLQHRAFRGEL